MYPEQLSAQGFSIALLNSQDLGSVLEADRFTGSQGLFLPVRLEAEVIPVVW